MTSTLRLGLLLIVLTVTSYYAVLQFRVVRIPHPITPDEPGFVEITAAGNPFTAAGVVACANAYGPSYPWWARPFTAVIANRYIAHRVASSVALFLALALLGCCARREGAGSVEISAGLAIVYILNVSSHSLVASTDLLGAALYLAALAASRRGTWTALIAGLVLTALATLTKPYFALAWLIVASHQILFFPPRRSLRFLALSAGFGLLVFGLLHAFAPYYFLTTFYTQGVASDRSLNLLLSQTTAFAMLAGGVILLAVLHRPRKRTLAFARSAPPLDPPVDLWAWTSLVATAALLGAMGWHPGNFLAYYYHLLLGPLTIVALGRMRDWPRLGPALLAVNLLVLGWLLPSQPTNDNWDALAADVSNLSGPILADPLLEPLTHDHPNLELFGHGQTASVLQALDNKGTAMPAAYREIYGELLRREEKTSARISAAEFSAIYLSYQNLGSASTWSYEHRHIIDALRTRYRIAGEVVIFPYATPYWDRLQHGHYPYHLTRWEPRAK
ncbi:MAG: hypothetical protein JWM35_2727 [Verrucomicrobia bacterium]|nr:hypothetical protein [Verrucomicrobiota bacterium]